MGLLRRNKKTKNPVIRQILDLVPRWMIESCVKKQKSDKRCSKYKTYDQTEIIFHIPQQAHT